MKVSCDFLPQEYKAFLLDTTSLTVSGLILAVTIATCLFTITSNAREKSSLTKDRAKLQSEVGDVVNQLKSISYDQAAIQELITKFQFIQKAMGATDYPYLRFYQAIEQALPRSRETSLKTVHVQKLARDGEKIAVNGTARTRSDITAFEKNLIQSKLGSKADFADVKILNTTSDPKTDNWSFEMQFMFQP